MDMDGRMIPGTPVNWPIPADGDDYTYKPPLIPAQWVPVTEYRHLVAMGWEQWFLLISDVHWDNQQHGNVGVEFTLAT